MNVISCVLALAVAVKNTATAAQAKTRHVAIAAGWRPGPLDREGISTPCFNADRAQGRRKGRPASRRVLAFPILRSSHREGAFRRSGWLYGHKQRVTSNGAIERPRNICLPETLLSNGGELNGLAGL